MQFEQNFKTEKILISRILHAGYLLQNSQEKIVFDPIFESPFSRNCHAFPSIQFNIDRIRELQLSAVFISHYHDDHCSFQSLNYLNRSIPIYIYCQFDEMIHWLRELGFKNVFKLNLNESVHIGDFTITALEALDRDVDCIFQIQVGKLKILNVVDSWIGPDTFKMISKLSWDLVLWPFQIMRELEVLSPRLSSDFDGRIPPELYEQLEKLNTRYLVPSSCQFKFEPWSWYNDSFFGLSYASFAEQVSALRQKHNILRLDPGFTVELSQESCIFGENLEWVIPDSRGAKSEDCDFSYDPKSSPQSTSQIARIFPPLSSEQLAYTLNYCAHKIAEDYNRLDRMEEGFFSQERSWRLVLWGHDGDSTIFDFQIGNEGAKRLEVANGEVDWQTEIPIQRLYGALVEGESLTSIYLRLHDLAYREEIERVIGQTDLFEDPLIRSLYEGKFGTYQKYQLSLLAK